MSQSTPNKSKQRYTKRKQNGLTSPVCFGPKTFYADFIEASGHLIQKIYAIMLEEVCPHDIEVLNLSEGEFVRQPILLIRGRIKNYNRSAENCSSKQEERPQVLLYWITDCFSDVGEKGEFKFILELPNFDTLIDGEVVELKLVFKYCIKDCMFKLKLEKLRSAFKLQPIYILCADEDNDNFAYNCCEKIDVNLRLVQAIYADRLKHSLGYPLTFVLNGACKIFRSDITREEAWKSDENFLWNYFAEELLRKNFFGDGINLKLKLVAFIGCTKYDGHKVIASNDLSYVNIRKHLRANSALGGGDFALFGSGYFYAWPSRFDEIISCLQNTRKVTLALEPDESNYRRTYLGVYATTLGAVCHELGHIFECGHTQNGIMGNGFDFVNRLLTISDRTENLPKRVIGNVPTNPTNTDSKSRLTRINRNPNEFLDNYHEQRKSDGFFFTRNCAVILENNKWFQNIPNLHSGASVADITFDAVNKIISCNNQALKIVEIRANSNGLVEKYFELPEASSKLKLEKSAIEKLEKTHYLYVLTEKGESVRFDLSQSVNEN